MDIITRKEDFEYYQGKFYFWRKNYKKALKYWKKLLKIAPHSLLAVKVSHELDKKKSVLYK